MKELTTPCFIFDKYEFERSINSFKTALNKNFSSNIIGYSVKTNSLPYCLCLARDMGCYAEVVSHDEYELALLCGYAKDHIIYNGPMKSKETFLDAITNGAIVNIETKRELKWLKDLPQNNTYSVGLRLNINISKVAPDDASSENDYGRFGFSDETKDLYNAISEIEKTSNVHLSGIHIHRSPHTRSVLFYTKTISYAAKIINKYNLKLNYIDVGGGFFGIFKDKPTYLDYSHAIKEAMHYSKLDKLTLIVEPGMGIVGSAFSFLSTVIDTKEIEPNVNIVTTNGSRNDIDPLFKKTNYIYELIYHKNHKDNPNSIINKQIITGCSCIESDQLFIVNDKPLLQENDMIYYKNVGAYTMCLSPLFIRYFPKIYLKENNSYTIIRNDWTVSEYIQKSQL